MSEPTGQRAIVIGIDGTPASEIALRWAVAEASTRALPLRVVAVYELPTPSVVTAYTYVPGQIPPPAFQERFDSAVAYARDRLDEGAVSAALVSGRPAQVILTETAGAEVLVVGSPGHSTVGGIVVGSVSAAAAGHAQCPVVVVRQNVVQNDAGIVVGVDGSPNANEALEFAIEHARSHGYPVTVVHGWDPFEDIDPAVWTPDRAAHRRDEREAWLTELVKPYQEKYPYVRLTTQVVDARPAEALATLSKAARMVIVGSRGHGGFAGLVLGSVSQNLLHHARCTVVVMHGAPGEQS